VEEIIIGANSVRSAKPGENVLLKFSLNVEDVQKGYVLCSASNVCQAVTEIRVQLALVDMLEHRPIFSPGYDCVMHTHTVEIEVHCAELIGVIDKGKPMKRPFARTGQVCIARLVMPLHTWLDLAYPTLL
jgi:peptide chain release factor subunit 3